MKKLFIPLFILLFFLNGIAQEEPTKQIKSNTASTPVINIGDYRTEHKIDTLHIASGKSYVFLIDVRKEYDDGVQVVGGKLDDEEKELLSNFEENTFEIIKQYKHVFILFDNGQTLDLTSINDVYQALVYWQGNIEDDVQIKEGLTMSTEFVAEQMGLNKQSSYITNNAKYKKELDLLRNKNNVTEKSKRIMNNYLDYIYKSFVTNKIGEDGNLYDIKPVNIKKMNLYITYGSKAKTLSRSIEMNEKGQIHKVILFNRDGENKKSIQYIYENEILKKTINDDGKTITYSYSDDKMISFANIGGANETKVYWLENDKINIQNYVIMIDNANSSRNMSTKIINEKNCVVHYIDGIVWSRNCSTNENIFPFAHTYTSYQDGEVLQYRKFKIEKKTDKIYEKYYSNAEQEADEDVYVLKGSYQLNNNNLVNKYTIISDQENINLEIEYIYNN